MSESPPKSEPLHLKAIDARGVVTDFKIRPTTKFSKLFRAIAEQKGVSPESLRFMFDGNRVKEDDTPQGLGMENGDSVDVMLEQLGGAFRYGFPAVLPLKLV